MFSLKCAFREVKVGGCKRQGKRKSGLIIPSMVFSFFGGLDGLPLRFYFGLSFVGVYGFDHKELRRAAINYRFNQLQSTMQIEAR